MKKRREGRYASPGPLRWVSLWTKKTANRPQENCACSLTLLSLLSYQHYIPWTRCTTAGAPTRTSAKRQDDRQTKMNKKSHRWRITQSEYSGEGPNFCGEHYASFFFLFFRPQRRTSVNVLSQTSRVERCWHSTQNNYGVLFRVLKIVSIFGCQHPPMVKNSSEFDSYAGFNCQTFDLNFWVRQHCIDKKPTKAHPKQNTR